MLEEERVQRDSTVEDKYKQIAGLEAKFAGMLEEEIQVFKKYGNVLICEYSQEEKVNQRLQDLLMINLVL